jgi:hypothetical protein
MIGEIRAMTKCPPTRSRISSHCRRIGSVPPNGFGSSRSISRTCSVWASPSRFARQTCTTVGAWAADGVAGNQASAARINARIARRMDNPPP